MALIYKQFTEAILIAYFCRAYSKKVNHRSLVISDINYATM